MFAKNMYNSTGFQNTVDDNKIIGFQFNFKIQYYRGITLSILRDILIDIDGDTVERENIRFSIKGETFTLEEMRTVVDYELRWEFGEWATVTVIKEGGLSAGRHHIKASQIIAPSYMPVVLKNSGEYDFNIL